MSLFDLSPQEQQGLFGDLLAQFGLNLMSGNKGLGANIGQAGLQSLAYRDQQTQNLRNQKRQGLQDQMLQAQLEQAQRAAQQQKQIDALAPQFFRPGQAPLTPGDDEGNPMPPVAPANDFSGYAQAIMGISPERGLAMKSQLAQLGQKQYQKLGPGEALFDPETRKPVFSNPKQESDPLSRLVAARDALPPNHPNRKLYDNAIAKATTHAPGTQVNVNTGKKPFLNAVGAGAGEAVVSDFNAAKSAVGTLQNVQQLREAIKGGVIAGPGANAQVLMEQIGQKLGVTGADSAERLQNTRALVQGLARQELAAAAGMKGQGQITESERGILKRAESGDIGSMTVAELNVLANALEKTARFKINQHGANMKRLQTDPDSADLVQYMALPEFEAPAQASPTPVMRYDKSGRRIDGNSR